MHRLVDVWALRHLYDRHTPAPQYFTDNEMTVSTTRSGASSSSVAGAVHLHGARRAFALALGVVNRTSYVLMVTIVGQYLIYETFHFAARARPGSCATRRSSIPSAAARCTTTTGS
jgi:hypothetical protein